MEQGQNLIRQAFGAVERVMQQNPDWRVWLLIGALIVLVLWGIRPIFAGLQSVFTLLGARKVINGAAPFALRTPHTEADIEKIVNSAILTSGTNYPEGSEEYSYQQAKISGYGFIDRGVSRAQGLLQFNSIVFGVIALFIAGTNDPYIKGLAISSTVAIVLSTLMSLFCMSIIWFLAEKNEYVKVHAKLVWQVWCWRALMFNISLRLSLFGFITAAICLLWKIIIAT